MVYIRYHFSCGLDRKDACWLSFTPLTGYMIVAVNNIASGPMGFPNLAFAPWLVSLFCCRFGRRSEICRKKLSSISLIASTGIFSVCQFAWKLGNGFEVWVPLFMLLEGCWSQFLFSVLGWCVYHLVGVQFATSFKVSFFAWYPSKKLRLRIRWMTSFSFVVGLRFCSLSTASQICDKFRPFPTGRPEILDEAISQIECRELEGTDCVFPGGYIQQRC